VESLGKKLRTTRENRGLALDQASRETNISTRFLDALENENFSEFPGETYITGFLRNYSAYLELDVNEMLSLYRALRIQEQPIPVEQLIKSPLKISKILIPAVIILAVLCLTGGGIYYFLFLRPEKPKIERPAKRNPVEHVMEGNSLERRLYINDSVLITIRNTVYKLELINLGEAVTISSPVGSIILDLSQEAGIDLNNSGIPNLRVIAADFVKNNADMGVLLSFSLLDIMPDIDENADFFQSTEAAVSTASITVIPSSFSPYPFTLQIVFQGYCMFRWEILFERDRRDRNERYFQRTDELNIQAQNGIRIWTSNAQAARFQVIGAGQTLPFDFGLPGEVVVADLRWVRDEDGRYRLILIRLES
jgi:cytoskeletal protein RodZ